MTVEGMLTVEGALRRRPRVFWEHGEFPGAVVGEVHLRGLLHVLGRDLLQAGDRVADRLQPAWVAARAAQRRAPVTVGLLGSLERLDARLARALELIGGHAFGSHIGGDLGYLV